MNFGSTYNQYKRNVDKIRYILEAERLKIKQL